MEFFELIKKRYSVRAYKKAPVEDEKIMKILEAACHAPTAANKQPFKFIIIQTRGRENELKQIYDREWFYRAPIVICCCALYDESWSRADGKNYAEVDATIAMDHLILAATDLGLGTCWIAAFDPGSAREVLRLPENAEPVAFTPVGYPDDEIKPKKRKDLSDIVRYAKW